MQRRPPAGTTRRVRSAMRCDKRPRSLTAKTSADFLRKRSGHAAQAPGGYNPPGTERNVPRRFSAAASGTRLDRQYRR